MGTVYRGSDKYTDLPIAVKLLRTRGVRDVERFVREVGMLADVSHPGIVRYVGHGQTPDGEQYLAMEWLEGETLADRFRRQRLTLLETVALGRRLADALAAAHGRGIVHRDLKPGNIFLPDGAVERVKLIDFGVGRRLSEQQPLTQTGTAVGTPAYMAPEQARGSRDIDERTDLFSLGCVLFECITGRAAFEGADLIAVLTKIVIDDPPRMQDFAPQTPARLQALVDQLLAKDRTARPANALLVKTELDALAEALAADTAKDLSVQRSGRIYDPDRASTLTGSEQRVVCMVLIGGADMPRDRKTHTARGVQSGVQSFDVPTHPVCEMSKITPSGPLYFISKFRCCVPGDMAVFTWGRLSAWAASRRAQVSSRFSTWNPK